MKYDSAKQPAPSSKGSSYAHSGGGTPTKTDQPGADICDSCGTPHDLALPNKTGGLEKK